MNEIGDDINQAYANGFADGEWDMFEMITGLLYGKQCYFLESNGIVYSRRTWKYLRTKDEAVKEFTDDYCRW